MRGEEILLQQVLRRLNRLERRVGDLVLPETGVRVSRANVSNPPTDAELDGAFGTPAAVGAGFVGLVDDNGAGAAVWVVYSDGTNWWYEGLTKAV